MSRLLREMSKSDTLRLDDEAVKVAVKEVIID